MSDRTARTWRAIILLAFAALGVAYAAATPIFEKNDEDLHFGMAWTLARGRGLPVQDPGHISPVWGQEASQPPLYYALASLVVRAFNTDDFEKLQRPNAAPNFTPFAPSNRNKLIVEDEKRAFAYRGSTMAAFVLRLLGIAAGLVTVALTFSIAHAVSRRNDVALAAMALTAFNPMLLTVMTAVTNDSLVIALSTLGLWLLARCLLDGATAPRVLALGLVCALAALSKLAGLMLPAVSVVALVGSQVTLARRENRAVDVRGIARPVALIGVVFAVVAGWWFVRNQLLYGELTGTSTMALAAGPRHISLGQVLGEATGFKMSYLAMFGQFNVAADDFVYRVWDLVLALSVAGLFARAVLALPVVRAQTSLRGVTRALSPRGWLVVALLLHAALVLLGIVRWTMMTPATQGRLWFPAIASLSTFMAIGLATLTDMLKTDRWRRAPSVAYSCALLMSALAIVAPFRYVAPAFAQPLADAMPRDATSAKQTLSPWAEVIGYSMSPSVVRPGEAVLVRVYLRALSVPDTDYLLVTRLYGRDGALLDRHDGYTGGGLLPSSAWKPGQIWHDDVPLRVPVTATAPAILRAQFDLFSPYFGTHAKSLDANGRETTPLFDGATLLPAQDATRASLPKALARFGDIGALTAFTRTMTSGAMELSLAWRAAQPTSADYVAFVHLLRQTPDGERLVAQNDSPHINGDFPTSRWGAGVQFQEVRRLSAKEAFAPGSYRVAIGLYDPATGARVPVTDANGQRARDDAVTLETFVLP